MLREVGREILPQRTRFLIKKFYFSVVDCLLGRGEAAEALCPPRSLNFAGGGDYRAIGEEFLGHFIQLAGLEPQARIVDVGCGVGRMAVPLSGFLSSSARYEGFDVVREGIDWCVSNISTRYPNFRFQHADIYNRNYNPRGKLSPAEFRFPYPDAGFDLAILTSVFTHMLPPHIEHYLDELSRILRPGGRAQ